jgi:hypothetical protein
LGHGAQDIESSQGGCALSSVIAGSERSGPEVAAVLTELNIC